MKEYDHTENIRLLDALSQFQGKRILVCGDIMLDKYIWGDVTRISPEAPVQVVHVTRETYAPGGAANVATNAAALKGNVFVVGLIGKDEAANILRRDMQDLGINVDGMMATESFSTIQKVRIVGKNQQLLRVDYETKERLTEELEKLVLSRLDPLLEQIDCVVISDYAKGLFTRDICASLIRHANEAGKSVVVDPKPGHRDFYENATIITPNLGEAKLMAHASEDQDSHPSELAMDLSRKLNAHILVTLGEKGMCLCEKSGTVTEIPVRAREVYSLVGAGDTVAACIALALASGVNVREAALLANIAAGIKVGKVGTATVTLDEIRKEIEMIDAHFA